MTDQERLLIDALFSRLNVATGSPRDPETEQFITAKLSGNPGMAYALAQTVLMQNQELAAAEARIVNLRAKLEKAGGEAQGPFMRDDLRAASRRMPMGAKGFLANAAVVTLAVTGI